MLKVPVKLPSVVLAVTSCIKLTSIFLFHLDTSNTEPVWFMMVTLWGVNPPIISILVLLVSKHHMIKNPTIIIN